MRKLFGMEKVLLLTGEDIECLELISLIAEGEFDFQTYSTDLPDKALAAIDKLGDNLVGIINTYKTTDILNGRIFTKNQSSRKAPYIDILAVKSIDPDKYQEFYADNAYNFLVPKEKIHKEIYQILSKIEKRYDLDTDHAKPVTKDGKRLYRIKIDRYLTQLVTVDDIYIKIGAGKYIKLFHAGDDIDKDKIMEYKAKGEKFLYQAEEDFLRTVNSTMNSIVKKFKDKSLSKAQTVGLQLATIKEVQDAVRNMGISDSVIETTDELVNSVEKMLKDSKQLGGMIKKLLGLKSRYFTRTSINNYLLGGIAEKMGWESHQTLKKLIYASVFCDFSFEMSEAHLSEALSFEDPIYMKATKVQKLRVKTHPKLSAAILEKGDKLLTDEAALIMHHHEKPDGTGFPAGLDYKTLPVLSCAFILAYDYTTKLIQSCDSPDELDPLAVLRDLGEDYSKANFNKPYQCLKEIVNK